MSTNHLLIEILSVIAVLYAIYLWCRNIFLLLKGIRCPAIVDHSQGPLAKIKYSANGADIEKPYFRLAVDNEDEDFRPTVLLYHPKYPRICVENSIFSLYLVPGIFALLGGTSLFVFGATS
jgi:hypothetical protein